MKFEKYTIFYKNGEVEVIDVSDPKNLLDSYKYPNPFLIVKGNKKEEYRFENRKWIKL